MRQIKWLLLAAALVVLAVTNPPMPLYTAWAVQEIQAYASGVLGALSSVFPGSLASAVASSTVRDNYLLFSIYRTNALGYHVRVLGLVNHFIPLSKLP